MSETIKKRCEYCGGEFTASKYAETRTRYCSVACQKKAYQEGKGRRFTFVCKRCGCEYQTAYRNRDQYCSRECAYEDIGRWHVLAERPTRSITVCFVRVCRVCGSILPTGIGAFCSDECRKESARRRQRRYDEARYPPPMFKCKECGEKVSPSYGDKRRVFCSPPCARRWGHRQQTESRRRANRIRSARLRAARRKKNGGGNIDPLDVFAHDGWHCYLCGCETPPDLRGTYEDMAPELDHIEPISRGGLHRLNNVACACRRCNNVKGDSEYSQGLYQSLAGSESGTVSPAMNTRAQDKPMGGL